MISFRLLKPWSLETLENSFEPGVRIARFLTSTIVHNIHSLRATMLHINHGHWKVHGARLGQLNPTAARQFQSVHQAAWAAPLLHSPCRKLVVTVSPAAFRDDADVIPSGMDDDEDDEDYVAV